MPKHLDQLVLDLPFRQALEREDFFVSPANEQGVAAIDKWPEWPNPVMVLVGPRGVGKTHLTRVWQKTSAAKIIEADQLTIDAIPQLMEYGAVAIEGLPEPALDEKALFHLINLAREQKKFVLLSSLTPPAQWNIALPDLASRLSAAGLAKLDEPDDALLRAILIKQFADRQITVDEQIISYMVARMERSANAARELVAEIDRQALRQKANVTRPFVSGIMNQQLDLPDI